MANTCPNKNSDEWKNLVADYGEVIAYAIYDRAGEKIPSPSQVDRIVAEMGISYRNLSDGELKKYGFQKKDGKPRIFSETRADELAEKTMAKDPSLHIWRKTADTPTTFILVGRRQLYKAPPEKRVLFPEPNTFYAGDEALESQEMYQLTNASERKAEKELDQKMQSLLTSLGVTYDPTTQILDSQGRPITAIAKADLTHGILSVIEGKADVTTLPEEAAHFIVAMLKDSPLVERLRNAARETEAYKQVVAEYKDVYTDEGVDNETKLLDEAVGKLIAQEIVKIYDEGDPSKTNETEKTKSTIKKLWDRIVDFLKRAMQRVGITSDWWLKEVSPFREVAQKMMSEDITNLKDISEIEGYFYEYTMSPEQWEEAARIKEALESQRVIKDPTSKSGYRRLDGTEVDHRVSDLIHAHYNQQFRNSDGSTNPVFELLKAKGTAIHSWAEHIMKDLSEGNTPERIAILDKVFEAHRDSDTMKDKPRGFYSITTLQFNNLVTGLRALYDQIQEKQAEINKQTKTEGKATFYFENSFLGDGPLETDMAGTIDLLVLYSNGMVDMFDYKCMRFETYKDQVIGDIAMYKQIRFDIQISQYKKILYEKYGVKNFSATRIIPINIQPNQDRVAVDGTRLSKEIGLKTLEIGDGINTGKEYLDQLPVSGELTEDPGTNEILERLYRYKSSLLSKQAIQKSRATAVKIEKTTKLINNIIIKRNFSYAYEEINNMVEDYLKREAKLPEDPKAISMPYINDILNSLKVFEGYVGYSAEALKELNDPAVTALVERIPAKIEQLQYLIERRKQDVMRTSLDGLDIDLKKPGVVKNSMFNLTKSRREFDHPVFQKYDALVTAAYGEINSLSRDAVYEIEDARDKLIAWAKSQGLSESDAYLKLYNKETGKLYTKYDPKFYKDQAEARLRKDKGFFLKYYQIERRNGKLYYTGKAKESYEKFEKWYEGFLEEQYPGDFYKAHREKKMWQFKKQNDITFNNDVLFSPDSRFVRTNIASLEDDYLSKEYRYIREHEGLRQYHEMYVRMLDKFADATGMRIDSNFVANILQGTAESMSAQGFGAISSVTKTVLNSFETLEENQRYMTKEEALNLDLDGKPIRTVPLPYMKAIRIALSKQERAQVTASMPSDLDPNSNEYKNLLSKRIVDAEYEKGVKNKSYDLSKNLALMAKGVYTYQKMSEIESFALGLLYELKNNKVYTTLDANTKKLLNHANNTVLKKLGVEQADIDIFERFINLNIYGKSSQNAYKGWKIGEKLDEEGNVINPGREISAYKSINDTIKYSSMAQLGFKPLIAGANLVQNFSNAYFVGIEGQYFTVKTFNEAIKERYVDHKKYEGVMDFLNTAGGNIHYEKSSRLSAFKSSKVFSSEAAYFLMQKTDDTVEKKILVAAMKHWGINEKGRVVPLSSLPDTADKRSLYDRVVQDEKGRVIDIEGLSKNEQARFRAIVQNAGEKVRGMSPLENRLPVTTMGIGPLLMQYRSWLVGLVKAHLSGLRYDYNADLLDVGRFTAVWQDAIGFSKEQVKNFMLLAVSSIPIIGYFTGKALSGNTRKAKKIYKDFIAENPESRLTFEEFVHMRMGKLRAAAAEIQTVVAFWLIAMLVKGLIPDDKQSDPVKTFLAQSAFRLANRAFMEVSFFINANSVTEILQSPFAMLGFGQTIYKMLDNLADESRDLLVGKDMKGVITWEEDKKDRTPVLFYTSKLLPGVNALVDSIDYFDRQIYSLGKRF